MNKKVINFFSGSKRPRQFRFATKLKVLCDELDINYELIENNNFQRLKNKIKTNLQGFRSIKIDDDENLGILHQTLNKGKMNYYAEIDLPFGIHNFNINIQRNNYRKAKEILIKDNLKGIITFSNWAKRNFGLHFGEEIEKKCITIYPLPYNNNFNLDLNKKRKYDFVFVSKSFITKGGREVIYAFSKLLKNKNQNLKLLCITDLNEAKKSLGNLNIFKNIDWIESNLSEKEVNNYLMNSRCLVHPTLSDSFGVVILEAMSVGCAIIASDIATIPELINKKNAFAIKAPTCTVVGDSYILEYGNTTYHKKYLKTLDLYRLENQILEYMILFTEDENNARKMMSESLKITKNKFSDEIWKRKIKKLITTN